MFTTKLDRIINLLNEATQKIFWHATSAKNLGSILRRGLVFGEEQLFTTEKLSGSPGKQNWAGWRLEDVPGVYTGNFSTALFYSGRIDKPIVIAVVNESVHVIRLDEATIRYIVELPEDNEDYQQIMHISAGRKLIEIYSNSEYPGDDAQIDAASGKLNDIITNRKLIKLSVNKRWPIVTDRIPIERIIGIWSFRDKKFWNDYYNRQPKTSIDTDFFFGEIMSKALDEAGNDEIIALDISQYWKSVYRRK